MAIECMQNCPVKAAIEKNIEDNKESDVLTDFFNKGLNSVLESTDSCQGPGEIQVERREKFFLRTKTVSEPLTICSAGISTPSEALVPPLPDLPTESNAIDGYLEPLRPGVFETLQSAQ